MGLVMCLSSARHEYIKVSYGSIVTLIRGKSATASSQKCIAQSEQIYSIRGLKRNDTLGNVVCWDIP